MADTEQQAMSEERLAEIRAEFEWLSRQFDPRRREHAICEAGMLLLAEVERLRARENEPQPSPWPLGVSAEVFIGGLKARIRELTDENKALRAREAALLAVVERVATMLYIPLLNDLGATTREICGGCARSFRRDDSGWFSADSRHAPDCVVEQARALLAGEQAPGEA